jgi:hypothetical protein
MKNSTNNQFLQISSVNVSDDSIAHSIEYAQFQDYCNSFTALEAALYKFKGSISAYKTDKSKRRKLYKIMLEEALGMIKIVSNKDQGQLTLQ